MKFSIITPVLNAGATIERTLASVLDQPVDELEYIVIDGGSTDGTLGVIDRYRGRLSYVQSRPDGGLYDAMNQGIAHATGDVVGIINADDYYLPGALSKVAAALNGRPLANLILWGDVEYESLGRVRGFRRSKLHIGAFAPHPSMFVPREVYTRIGAYDTSFRYLADYDFMYRAIHCEHIEPVHLPEILAYFSAGGLSDRHVVECLKEELLVKLRHGQCPWLARLVYRLKLLKNFRRILS